MVAAKNDLLISSGPANGALVSCTKASLRIQPQPEGPRGLRRREGCSPHNIVRERVQRDVAYLILGNYGGTMKGARSLSLSLFLSLYIYIYSCFGGHCSCPLSFDENLIFLLIMPCGNVEEKLEISSRAAPSVKQYPSFCL